MNAFRLAPLPVLLAVLGWCFAGCSVETLPPEDPGPNGAGTGPLVSAVVHPCVPDCEGKTCGFDGCFDQCGICATGEACVDDQCVPYVCQPTCDGRTCGDDGCGGSCGECDEGEFCLEVTGTCTVPDPCMGVSFEGCCDGEVLNWCSATTLETLDCESGCGWDPEIGEYNCGTDGGADPSGTFPLSCEPEPCSPSCDGLTCGDDGCGTSCGECEGGLVCDYGVCYDPALGHCSDEDGVLLVSSEWDTVVAEAYDSCPEADDPQACAADVAEGIGVTAEPELLKKDLTEHDEFVVLVRTTALKPLKPLKA
ncbi:MAG: hypothetical protein QF464_00010, partial [Myxococcota bacterium]|nr:hypothetical protein [Myxococcota bacterium]